MPNDADWQAPNSLTPQEEQLLALVREGKVDAEIAVRLGISNSEVKERVERIVRRLGLRERSELRTGPEPEPEPAVAAAPELEQVGRGFGRWMAFAAALGLLAGVGTTWFAMRESGEPAAAPTVSVDSSGVAEAEASNVANYLITAAAIARRTPPSSVRGGRTVIDAGPLFVGQQGGSSLDWAETHGEVVLVHLKDAAVFPFDNGVATWRPVGCIRCPSMASFVSNFDGRSLSMAAGDSTEFLWGADGSMGIFSRSEDAPAIILWMEQVQMEVGSDGHLYIDTEPIPVGAAVAFDTGEILDVSGAQRLGSVSGSWNLCAAEDSGVCYVIARPAVQAGQDMLLFPVDGLLTCRADGVLELRATDFRLDFHRLSPGGPADPGCEPFSTTATAVKAGEAFSPPRHRRIKAFDSGGHPISIVVARDGTLYVGEIRLRYGCPCRSGT